MPFGANMFFFCRVGAEPFIFMPHWHNPISQSSQKHWSRYVFSCHVWVVPKFATCTTNKPLKKLSISRPSSRISPAEESNYHRLLLIRVRTNVRMRRKKGERRCCEVEGRWESYLRKVWKSNHTFFLDRSAHSFPLSDRVIWHRSKNIHLVSMSRHNHRNVGVVRDHQRFNPHPPISQYSEIQWIMFDSGLRRVNISKKVDFSAE